MIMNELAVMPLESKECEAAATDRLREGYNTQNRTLHI